MSAAPQRGGVVDAVAGHRHDLAEVLQRVGDAHLGLGGAAGEDQLLGRPRAARRAPPRSSRPARRRSTTRRPCGADARPAGRSAGAVSAVVAGDHHAAGCRRRGSARPPRRTSGRGGSTSADQAEQRQVALRRPRGPGRCASVAVDARGRPPPARAARCRCPGAVRASSSRRGRSQRSAARAARVGGHVRAHAAGPPPGRPWCAPRTRRRRRGRRSTSGAAQGRSGTRGSRASARRPGSDDRARRASVQQGQLGRVADRSAAGVAGARGVAGDAARGEQPRATSLPPVPGRRPEVGLAAGRSSTRTDRIRFIVSVPVLSVQITLVEPSVSTAREPLDQRAAAGRARRTPTASASVIVGSRPSGTLATSRPMAKLKVSPSGSPVDQRCRAATNATPGRRPRRGRSAGRPGCTWRLQRAAARLRPAGTARRSGRARCACRSRRRPPRASPPGARWCR